MAEIRTLKDQDTQVLPRTRAEAVTMADGKTLQEKYDAGELGGSSGNAQQIVDAHNVSASAHENMGWITTKDGEPSAPAKINADSLGGIPAAEYISKNGGTITGSVKFQLNGTEDVVEIKTEDRGDAGGKTFWVSGENMGMETKLDSIVHTLTSGYALTVPYITFLMGRYIVEFNPDNPDFFTIADMEAEDVTQNKVVTVGDNLSGDNYTAFRPRGIALMSSKPASIPNGCIVGVYE